MKLSVIGLGKLGAPLAAVMASKGHTVVGLDLNAEFVEKVKNGQAPVEEPRLQELMDASGDRLTATLDYEEAILGTEASFVIVPTPSDENGIFTNKYLLGSIEKIGQAIKKKSDYHLVVITSTVMPGSTGGEIQEALEKHSGRKVGEQLGLCYNPEFIALGSVVNDMLKPDVLLIGESDAKAGETLEGVYKTSVENTPSVQRMNFMNAELTKISINTYVTTKISYANMLADICDRLPEADVDVVTEAVGSDSRIGTKYLKGALGYGGPCFPRDNVAFSVMARNLGTRADIAEATDRINKYQIGRLGTLVENITQAGGKIGVLGLSYKPDTGVIEESQGVELSKQLAAKGYSVTVYDPKALAGAMEVLGESVQAASSIEECARESESLVICTPWPDFKSIDPAWLRRDGSKLKVVDCWRVLDTAKLGTDAEIIHLGRGTEGWSDRVIHRDNS